MIQLKTLHNTHKVVPTIFPDGTSQIWKLPEEVMKSEDILIVWNFEAEREIFDIINLVQLLPTKATRLSVDYLPYARQDKEITNKSTFALHSFAALLNGCHFSEITTLDVHSDVAASLIKNLYNKTPDFTDLIQLVQPTYLIAPDKGAKDRYLIFDLLPTITFEKIRNQETGQIVDIDADLTDIQSGDSFLIIDDICDGGRTFIEISKKLHEVQQNIGVDLYVTHGIFSQGIQPLYEAGITNIWTTNSLPRKHNVNVIEV